jgi:hypothetical protein
VSENESELGPIDYVVVEFAQDRADLNGAMAVELVSLVEAELICVLDVLLMHKAADGSIEVVEFEDLGEPGELRAFEGRLAEVFAAEDIETLAAAVKPGSTALALLWANTWAAPFEAAARRSGGQLVASGRIPTQALMSALSAGEDGD